MVSFTWMGDAARARRNRASAPGVEGTGWDISHTVRSLLSNQAHEVTRKSLVWCFIALPDPGAGLDELVVIGVNCTVGQLG